MTATAKPARRLQVMARLDRAYIPAVLVTEGKKADAYTVFTSPGAVHWQHRAGGGRNYRVTCVAGRPLECTCDGFKFRGACLHTAASV